MEREVYGIKLKSEDSKVPIFSSYVRGSSAELKLFLDQVYGRLSERVVVKQLTKEGNYRFPWKITQKIFDLEDIFREEDKSFYLIKISESFFLGTSKELKKYPSLFKNSLKVRLTNSEFEEMFRIFTIVTLNDSWFKFENKRLGKLKKYWNRKVRV